MTNRRRTSLPPGPTTDTLDAFELLCDRWLVAAPPHRTLAVALLDHGTTVVHDLGALHDPVTRLLGFDAPAEWQGFGLVSPASLDDGHRAHVAYLCDRHGADLAAWTRHGGVARSGEVLGRLPDVCRRVLGVPTAPPTVPSVHLLTACWLHEVLAVTLDRDLGDQPPDWAEIASLHPAARGMRTTVDELIGAALHLAGALPWAVLRRRASARTLEGAVTGALAAWMDDGMFCRWVLDSHPPVDELTADLGELLDAPTVSALRRCLAAWA